MLRAIPAASKSVTPTAAGLPFTHEWSGLESVPACARASTNEILFVPTCAADELCFDRHLRRDQSAAALQRALHHL